MKKVLVTLKTRAPVGLKNAYEYGIMSRGHAPVCTLPA